MALGKDNEDIHAFMLKPVESPPPLSRMGLDGLVPGGMW